MTEELADALTPDKDDSTRVDILKDLATVIKRQGSYHLACKKYTQAGDRLKVHDMLYYIILLDYDFFMCKSCIKRLHPIYSTTIERCHIYE
jgi:hypothetical protein